MKTATILPEAFLRCLSSADRRKLGQYTAEEVAARAEVKNEKDLHRLIRGILGLKGIEFIESRMDKRTTQKKGVPDFIFSVGGSRDEDMTFPCAWELKAGKGELRIEQQQMAVRLHAPPNFWYYRVIRSVDEALIALREVGIQ